MQLSPVSVPSRGRVAAAVVVIAVLAPIVGVAPGGIGVSPVASVAAQGPAPVVSPADGPASERHGRSELDVQLLSRTFDPASGTYEIQVRATLDSRLALCLPVAFDCILEPETDPADAELVEIDCPGPLWNHLGFFTDVCLKQFFTAGGRPAVPAHLPDAARQRPRQRDAARPIRPWSVPDHAPGAGADPSHGLVLDAQLDLTTTCPADTVDAGDPIDCTLSVAFPDTPDVIPVAAAEIAGEVHPGGARLLAHAHRRGRLPAGAEWSCAATGCTLTGVAAPAR